MPSITTEKRKSITETRCKLATIYEEEAQQQDQELLIAGIDKAFKEYHKKRQSCSTATQSLVFGVTATGIIITAGVYHAALARLMASTPTLPLIVMSIIACALIYKAYSHYCLSHEDDSFDEFRFSSLNA